MQSTVSATYPRPQGNPIFPEIGATEASLQCHLRWSLRGLAKILPKCKPKQKLTSPPVQVNMPSLQASSSDGASSSGIDEARAAVLQSERVRSLEFKLVLFPKGVEAPAPVPAPGSDGSMEVAAGQSDAPSATSRTAFEPCLGIELCTVAEQEEEGGTVSPSRNLADLKDFDRSFAIRVAVVPLRHPKDEGADLDTDEDNGEPRPNSLNQTPDGISGSGGTVEGSAEQSKPVGLTPSNYYTFTPTSRFTALSDSIPYDSLETAAGVVLRLDVVLIATQQSGAAIWDRLKSTVQTVSNAAGLIENLSPLPLNRLELPTLEGFAGTSGAEPSASGATSGGEAGATRAASEGAGRHSTYINRGQTAQEEEAEAQMPEAVRSYWINLFLVLGIGQSEAPPPKEASDATNGLSPRPKKPTSDAREPTSPTSDSTRRESEAGIYSSSVSDVGAATTLLNALISVDMMFLALPKKKTESNDGVPSELSRWNPPARLIRQALGEFPVLKSRRYQFVPEFTTEVRFWRCLLSNLQQLMLTTATLGEVRQFLTALYAEADEVSQESIRRRNEAAPTESVDGQVRTALQRMRDDVCGPLAKTIPTETAKGRAGGMVVLSDQQLYADIALLQSFAQVMEDGSMTTQDKSDWLLVDKGNDIEDFIHRWDTILAELQPHLQTPATGNPGVSCRSQQVQLSEAAKADLQHWKGQLSQQVSCMKETVLLLKELQAGDES
jgi:hypothetical protein